MRFCLLSKLNWLGDTLHKQQAEHKEGTHRQMSLGWSCQLSDTPLAGHTAAQPLPKAVRVGSSCSDCPGDVLAFVSTTYVKCNLTATHKLQLKVKYSEKAASMLS